MRILVTNDDGIRAPGIVHLVEVARQFGEVKIVAPDHERSACGHSLTMRDPLRIRRVPWNGIEAYEVNGVPTDCVNLARTVAWPDGIDLVLSGVNWGPNLGFDVTYSGTVGAAMEGTINGIRSVAVSLALFVDDAPPRWEAASYWLQENFRALVEAPLAPLTFLNVNIPSIDPMRLRGTRIATMGKRVYADRVEPREDPWGRTYYWQGGVVVMSVAGQEGTDVEAVSEGFTAVTPITLDWTDHAALEGLRRHWAGHRTAATTS